jgi:hypothetical protein
LLDLNVHPASGGDGGVPDLEVTDTREPAAVPAARVLRVAPVTEDQVRLAWEGADPLAARLALLAGPYRRPVDLDRAVLAAADTDLRAWRAAVAGWAESPSAPMPPAAVAAVVGALADDLDVATALAALRRIGTDPATSPGARFEAFAHLDRLLGLDLARDVGR